MNALDFYILALFCMHLLETSIFLVLIFKILLHKPTITKIFYIKVLVITFLALFLIYLSTELQNLVTINYLNLWVQFVSPMAILIIIFYYCRFILIETKVYTDYFGEKSLIISFIALILIYMQVSIFNFSGVPTFIIILRIIFP